ncbi:MAG: type II secretion system F family protein [Bryobacteraceae bacterium]
MDIVLVAFFAMFVLISSAGLLVFHRKAMLDRLSAAVAAKSPTKDSVRRFLEFRSKTSVEKIVGPFERVLPKSPEEVSVIQKRLLRAGYRRRSDLNIFYGSKVLTPLVLIVLATVTGAYHYGPLFVYGIAGGLGFLLPDFWLGKLIAARQLNIRLGLPEALDLFVVCVEAGLGVDQAMLRVADELRLSQPAISREFRMVNLEQRAGRPRAEAWKNLAERTGVDSVRALVNAVNQADSFGTSVSKILRVYSDTLRMQRRQQAEEEAAKTTVKLVFPLVLFIFPALFVVVLGPSAIVMMEAFEKHLSN